jgi:SAM-dependent methyltransferase
MGLYLTKSQFQSICKFFEVTNEPSDMSTEIEAIISKSISFYQFQRLLNYLDNTCLRSPLSQTLDISTSQSRNVRLTLSGIADISAYCKNNKVASAIAIQKDKNVLRAVEITEHDIVIRCNHEIQIMGHDYILNILNSIQSLPKTYRLKSRTSFVPKDHKNFRIDCTAVKMPKNSVKRLHMSKMTNMVPRYEVEIEYIGELPVSDASGVSNEFLQIVSEVSKVLDDEEYLMPKSHKLETIKKYHSLTSKEPFDLIKLQKSPKKFFAGPQPVSFELRHMLATNSESVLHDYTITHKADGERTLLYVDDKGKVFLINNRMTVKSTKIVVPTFANSLFDSEVISISNKKAVHIFDSYYKNKILVAHLNLIADDKTQETRMKHAESFKQFCQEQDPRIEIDTKTFEIPNSINEFSIKCSKLLDAQKTNMLPFNTDGLIFTHRTLPVGANKENDPPNLQGTWARTLKWKPPRDNTIDFLIIIKKTLLGDDVIENDHSGIYKVLDIYVGKTILPSSPWEYLTSNGKPQKSGYVPVQFNPGSDYPDGNICKVPCNHETKELRCLNNDIITDESIVEMSWSSADKKWLPLRVRIDKTELYKHSLTYGHANAIGGTANDSSVATAVWNTIIYPVTEDILIGGAITNSDLIPQQIQSVYYNREKTVKNSVNSVMNKFHNIWIKSKQLLKPIQGKTTLMDLGCGKGGDLSKWIKGGYTTVLGLDLFEDNITNPYDGVYSRLLKEKSKNSLKYVFLPFNVSTIIDEDSINKIENVEHKLLARHFWGFEKIQNPVLDNYYRIAENKFDIISCQFATHYFFKNDDTLHAFCVNVKNHLKPGGLFIGTCFDGETIEKLFTGKTKDEEIVGQIKGVQSWGIQKKYEKYTPMTTGQAINVYVETINQWMVEYLVDFNLLISQLQKHGIRQLNDDECVKYGFKKSSGMFSDLYKDLETFIQENPDSNEIKLLSELLTMPDVNKTFSFLNRWFVFTKEPVDDIKIKFKSKSKKQ